MSKFVPDFIKQAAVISGSAFVPLIVLIALISPVLAVDEVYVDGAYGVSGYDPVAYHTVGRPVPGDDRFTASHDGITYRFSSATNRATFTADPASYVPAYGGFCAYGTSVGRKFPGDPEAWKIVEGTLYLNLNAQVQQTWLEDVPGYIRGADHNWPIIKSVADAQLENMPPDGLKLGAQ